MFLYFILLYNLLNKIKENFRNLKIILYKIKITLQGFIRFLLIMLKVISNSFSSILLLKKIPLALMIICTKKRSFNLFKGTLCSISFFPSCFPLKLKFNNLIISRTSSDIIYNKIQKRFYSQSFFLSLKILNTRDTSIKENDLLITASSFLEKETITNSSTTFEDGYDDPEFLRTYYE
jgi:hypothetical protein